MAQGQRRRRDRWTQVNASVLAAAALLAAIAGFVRALHEAGLLG